MQQQAQALEWNGDAYDRLSDMQYGVAMDNLAELGLRGDETIIDAGCGSGRITREILARLPRGRVVGVDVSASMLETARRTVIPKATQQIEFLQADLQTFCREGLAHGIFSNMALHFVPDHNLLFRNFYTCLRSKGFVALQFGSAAQDTQIGTRMLHLMQEPPFAEHLHASAFAFRGGTVEATCASLAAAGFEGIDVSSRQVPFEAQHASKMLEFFRSTVAKDCDRRLPTEALRREFSRQLEAVLDSAFSADFEYIRVRAHKP